MCTNYTPTRRDRWVEEQLSVRLPRTVWPDEAYPGYLAPIVALDQKSQQARCELARFGLIPFWTKDAKFGRRTYNARSETASSKPSFRTAWRERRYALAPMDNFYEPHWGDPQGAGRPVRWRIERGDGQPFAAASLWEHWTDPQSGEMVTSFSMLTVNADEHEVMKQFHRPGDEKRMLVIVAPVAYDDWLHATPETAAQMMRQLPAAELVAQPAPRPSAARKTSKTGGLQGELLAPRSD